MSIRVINRKYSMRVYYVFGYIFFNGIFYIFRYEKFFGFVNYR